MILNQQIDLRRDQPAAARNTMSDQQFHPSLHSGANGANGFDTWWSKTSAQHTAVIQKASALMRAHRRISAKFD